MALLKQHLLSIKPIFKQNTKGCLFRSSLSMFERYPLSISLVYYP